MPEVSLSEHSTTSLRERYIPPGAERFNAAVALDAIKAFLRSVGFTGNIRAGQGDVHNRAGYRYDHTNAIDVGLNPRSPAGQRFRDWLIRAGIPFQAFFRAEPGVSTGPHFHIGLPSKHGGPYPVGTLGSGASASGGGLGREAAPATAAAPVITYAKADRSKFPEHRQTIILIVATVLIALGVFRMAR